MSSSRIGIAILLVSLMCLGTWPALLRLTCWQMNDTDPGNRVDKNASTVVVQVDGDQASFWKIQQPRHPCHAYLDYGLVYALASILYILASLAVASPPEGSLWIGPLVGMAGVGGTLLSLGNLSMQWATSVFGAPLTTVLALQASLTVVIGTLLNYALQPERTNHVDRLGMGVVFFLLAIGLAARAQVWYSYGTIVVQEATPCRTSHSRRRDYTPCGDIELEASQSHMPNRKDAAHVVGDRVSPFLTPCRHAGETRRPATTDHVDDSSTPVYTSIHTNSDPHQIDNHTTAADNFRSDNTLRGLVVAMLGGICFGFFSPAFNIAVNNPFQLGHTTNPTDADDTIQALSVPAANLWFALAFSLVSVLGNVLLMSYPPKSHATGQCIVPASSIRDYWYDSSVCDRRLALSAGCLCATANVLQFQGAKLAGFAAADMVQAFPLVATVWDIVLFGEFRNASRRVMGLLVGMYVAYLGGIGLLAASIVA